MEEAIAAGSSPFPIAWVDPKECYARCSVVFDDVRVPADHLIAGEANKMIAYELGASMRTIEHHRARVMSKMQAGSLPELVRMVLGRREA